jgi:hypothetical protein
VYRQVASGASFSNWWLPGSLYSQVCLDVAMSVGCESRSLVGGNNNLTWVGLCPVATTGTHCWAARFSADSQTNVSSLARAGWNSYSNGWGQGLKIWLRE